MIGRPPSSATPAEAVTFRLPAEVSTSSAATIWTSSRAISEARSAAAPWTRIANSPSPTAAISSVARRRSLSRSAIRTSTSFPPCGPRAATTAAKLSIPSSITEPPSP